MYKCITRPGRSASFGSGCWRRAAREGRPSELVAFIVRFKGIDKCVAMGEGKEIREKWLHVRLSTPESHEINRLFKASAERYLSDFARKKLLGEPVRVATRNASQDGLIEQLAALRTELSRLGANYNQAVKKLHAVSRVKDFEHWLVAYELDRRKLLSQVEQAGIVIADLAEKWSQ